MSNRFQISVEEAFKLGVLEGEIKALKELKDFENTDSKFIKVYILSRLSSLEAALEIIQCYNGAKGDGRE